MGHLGTSSVFFCTTGYYEPCGLDSDMGKSRTPTADQQSNPLKLLISLRVGVRGEGNQFSRCMDKYASSTRVLRGREEPGFVPHKILTCVDLWLHEFCRNPLLEAMDTSVYAQIHN